MLPNENVFLTLSGHTHGVALNIKRDVGEPGRTVVEMLANYQFFEVGGQRRTGHMRLLQFDVDRSEISVNTYSPVLDDHNAEEFDTNYNRDYTAEADEFTVPVDLNSRTTQFSTDSIYLAGRTDDEIGSADVDGAGLASTTWDGLERGTRYGWFAAADDGLGGSSETPTSTFTTAEALEVDVSVEPAEPDGDNGWYVSPVTVTGVASDESATVEVNLDGSGWTSTDGGVLVVDSEGHHTVDMRAVSDDEVSETRSVEFSVDFTAPTVDIEGIEDGREFIHGAGDLVSWSFDDAGSGVGSVTIRVDGEDVDWDVDSEAPFIPGNLDPGNHELEIRVEDMAGNATDELLSFAVVEAPQWNARTVYRSGDMVTWEGTLYMASRRTRGAEPGARPNGPWQEIAPPDENGIAPWTSTRIYGRGDLAGHDGVVWEATRRTRGDEPGSGRGTPWRPHGE